MYCLDLSWITHNGSQCSGTVQALHSLLARWVCRDGGLRGCLQREVAKSCITAQSGRSRVPLHAGTTPHGPPHLSPCLASSVMLPSCSRFHLFFLSCMLKTFLSSHFPSRRAGAMCCVPLALSEPKLAPAAEQSMKRENSSAALEF